MFRRYLRFLAWVVLTAGALAAIVAIGYVALRLVPNWLDQSEKLDPGQEALERGRLRTAALVFLGGVVAAAGALFTGLTFHLSRRGQGTDRFNKAIELTGHKQRSVRLGGIYALGELAGDDPRRHHRAVTEVLLAYVRDHSPWPPSTPAGADDAQTATVPLEVPRAPTDVKAAMSVLARRKTAYDPKRLFIDLSKTNLRGIEAQGILLKTALLEETQLQEADLKGGHFEGAAFVKANLDRAELDRATLDKTTSFVKSSIVATSFEKTKGVEEADFNGAIYSPASTTWSQVPPAKLVVQVLPDNQAPPENPLPSA